MGDSRAAKARAAFTARRGAGTSVVALSHYAGRGGLPGLAAGPLCRARVGGAGGRVTAAGARGIPGRPCPAHPGPQTPY